MRRVRVSAAVVARTVVLAGGATAVAGVFLLWGLGIALLAAGVGAVGYGLTLVDVDRR